MKSTIISIVLALGLVGFAVMSGGGETNNPGDKAVGNVSINTEGVQVIEISAKGGYSPRMTKAKAGIPTVIKTTTNNTFDCSSFLYIPSMQYTTKLPAKGITEIKLPDQNAGSVLQGLCSMGMYGFQIKFE